MLLKTLKIDIAKPRLDSSRHLYHCQLFQPRFEPLFALSSQSPRPLGHRSLTTTGWFLISCRYGSLGGTGAVGPTISIKPLGDQVLQPALGLPLAVPDLRLVYLLSCFADVELSFTIDPFIDRDAFTSDMRSADKDSVFCTPYLVNMILADACVSWTLSLS